MRLRGLLAALCVLAFPGTMVPAADRPTALLVGIQGLPPVDLQLRHQLWEAGYNVTTTTLDGLTPAAFADCNVLVFTQFSVGPFPLSAPTIAALHDFVDEGGGALFIAGIGGYGDQAELVRNLGSVLTPWDAAIILEAVTDEQHASTYRGVLSYTYYATTRLAQDHPITRGLSQLYYPGPGGQHAVNASTYTLRLSADWHVVVRAEKTAHTPSVPSEPPLVAARQIGQGRVVLAAFDGRYFINDGYHPGYGRYVLGEGDGWAFLRQAFDWLAQPSVTAGRRFPGTPEPSVTETTAPAPQPPAPDAAGAALKRKLSGLPTLRTFRGIIGAHSSLSDGEASPSALVQAARQRGLDFLVFTEAYPRLDQTGWQRLVEACQRASDERFLAIPGLQVPGPEGERVCFNIERFPTPEQAADTGPRLLFDLNFPTIVCSRVHQGARTPWQLKFYTGLALRTYEHGQLVDDATADYRALASSDYRLIPVAVNRVSSPAEIAGTLRQAITYVNAATLQDLVDHPDWVHQGPLRTVYGQGCSYISSGPLLERLAVAVTENVYPQASAYAVTPGHKELFRLALRSDSPLVEVCVYRGEYLWRRFRPGRRRFRVDLWATSTRDDEPLSVSATDACGGMLHSNTLRKPYNPDFSYSLCVDKQNSIIVRGGLGMAAGFDASADGGAIYPSIPPERLLPAGEDASWCPVSWFALRPDFGLDPTLFRDLEGNPPYWSGSEPLMVSQRVCRLSSPDCIVWDNPTLRRFVAANARCIYLRPRLQGLSAIVVRQSVQALTDVPLNGSGLTLLTTMTNSASSPYPGFACGTGGALQTGEFQPHPPGVACAPAIDTGLRRGDWLALDPSPLGTVAVYSLAAEPLRGELGTTVDSLHTFVSGPSPWRNYIRLAVPLPGTHMPVGSLCEREFLFVLDASPNRGPGRLAQLRRRYGLDGEPGYTARVTQGDLLRSSFILSLRAADCLARFSLPGADLPDGLGVEVFGINPNWDAGRFDVTAGTLRRLGTVGDAAYCLFENLPVGDVMIGNLLTCSDPDVRLQLIEDTPEKLRLIAHNPTDRTISTTIVVTALVPTAAHSWRTRLRPGDLQEHLVRIPHKIGGRPRP